MRAAALPALLLIGLASACAPEPEPGGELVTEDVAPPVDEFLTTAFDEQRRRLGGGVGGALPQGFPGDLPLYSPANITAIDEVGGGWWRVTLYSPDGAERVAAAWGDGLRAAGWRGGPLSAAATEYSRGGRRVRLSLAGDPAGTRLKVAYLPES